jgi:GTPase
MPHMTTEIPEDDHDDNLPEANEPAQNSADLGPTRCGFVALIGVPNAGKSTLMNRLIGMKVSIVSRKVQTTRTLVRGIAMQGQAQLIFVDTPGIFAPRRRLDRAMVTSAWGGAGDADVIALLVDARKGIDEEVAALLARLPDLKQPKVLILNKIDAVDRPQLLTLAAELNEKMMFVDTFMISALTGDGTERLAGKLGDMMPLSPWLYPEDQVSDAPLRMLAAEVTREKLYERLHQELPYQSTVETDSWKELPDGSVRIEQTIFVERDSQKKIVLGEGGQTIKAIGQSARLEIQGIAETRVHLFLFVKVRENWGDDPARYREMGLEFPKG